MAGDQETLQKQLQEALEGQRRAEEEKLRAEEREKELEEQLKSRENLEGDLNGMREQKNSENRMRSTGFLEEGIFKWDVEVDRVGDDFIFSPYTDIGGLSFRIGCKKEMQAGSMKVPTHLYCNNSAANKAWSAVVACSFKLRASPIIYSCNILFGPSVSCHLVRAYNWLPLVDPSRDYIQNGRFNIEAKIKVVWYNKNTIIDFASPDPQLSDVILLVGGKKIHANRIYLALYCEYFKIIFFSEFAEKDKKEIELKDIDPEEFEEMLQVIYPQRKKPSAATVTGLLRMADFFDVNVIRVECSDFLLASTDFSFAAKILLSEEFHLVDLKLRLVKSLKNAKDVKAVIDSEDFGKLSLTFKNSLLEKYYHLTNKRAKRACAIL